LKMRLKEGLEPLERVFVAVLERPLKAKTT
jgi:hypothetical protein